MLSPSTACPYVTSYPALIYGPGSRSRAQPGSAVGAPRPPSLRFPAHPSRLTFGTSAPAACADRRTQGEPRGYQEEDVA